MSRLEKEFSARGKSLEAKLKGLRADQDKLTKDSAILGADEQKAKERKMLADQRELKRLQDEYSEDLSIRRNEELRKLEQKIAQTIVDLAKKESYDLVVYQGVIFASDKVDMTAKVLQLLKAQNRLVIIVAWTLAEIAKHVGGVVHGDEAYQVESFATLENAANNQISFLANLKYRKFLTSTVAGAVIVNAEALDSVPNNAIVVDDPYVAYAKAARLLNPVRVHSPGIASSAVINESSSIHSSASIGAQVVIESGVVIEEDVVIGPHCIIMSGSKIGAGTRLTANITLCEGVQIGQRCTLHPGVVIGADGFGIANDGGKWIKVPQVGSVKIGDDVEIGANTTIDRGAIEDTIIGQGVKLDNQIQIGHNTIVGDHTVIAGCVGIAGSTTIGKYCVIGGGVGIGGHLSIADNVLLTGMTMVTKSINSAGSYSSGIPAEPTALWHKSVIRYRQMDKLVAKVKELRLS